MIGQMAIAAALPGFNDLGRSVTPTFLCRNRFYSQLSPQYPKLNKKSIGESTPHFFYISDISNSSTLSGKSLRKKSMLENFRANVLKLYHVAESGE